MLMEKLPEFMGDEERYGKSIFSCNVAFLSILFWRLSVSIIFLYCLVNDLSFFFVLFSSSGADDFNVPRLVLNQFRWLDCIVQSKVSAVWVFLSLELI